MTEPTASRPVPGPYRPAPVPPTAGDAAPDPTPHVHPPSHLAAPAPGGLGDAAPETGGDTPLAALEGVPVAEHVAVFESEHARLQRELGTIDRL